jgi:hypothetical protein
MDKHGKPPQKLEDLIPEFIASIPPFPEPCKVHYYLSADGAGWTLDLHWTDGRASLIDRRTNLGLSSEDAERQIGTENGCYVLKAR